MIYYLLIILSTVLFTGQFLFVRGYQKSNGNTFQASLKCNSQSGLISGILMFAISRFTIEISPVLLITAAVQAGCFMVFTYCSIKAFKTANLSVYSLFTMLGGMMLPFVFGILYAREELTAGKIICSILIIIAIFIATEMKKGSSGAIKYYILVFIMNGMAGVCATFLKTELVDYNQTGYMALVGGFMFLFSVLIYLAVYHKFPVPKNSEIKYSAGYGLSNGIGNLLLLYALLHINASVQYPIVTGGTIIVSTIVSAIQKENVNKKNIIACVIALIASICIIL